VTGTVEVRRGHGIDDRAFVTDLGRRVVETSISAIRPATTALVEVAFDRLVAFIYARQHELLIAERDGTGERLGFILLLRDMPDEVTNLEQGFVAYMAVEPAAQRQGVGTALLRAAEDLSRAFGLPALSLMVTEDNVAARELYARAGFLTERRMMTKPL
jgi:ribosomal protein S18 acetylase RimI-like enzyme